MNIDGEGGMDVENDEDERMDTEPMSPDEYEAEYGQRAAVSKSARPTMLEGIRAFNAEKQTPVPGRRSSSELDI